MIFVILTQEKGVGDSGPDLSVSIYIKFYSFLTDKFHMIDLALLEKSQKMFEEAKAFFSSLNLPDCVIEISDKPMGEWVVHYTPTEAQMSQMRGELYSRRNMFIAIYTVAEGTYFYYSDLTIRTLELLNENKIVFSDVKDFEEVDFKKVQQEFMQLKKILEGL